LLPEFHYSVELVEEVSKEYPTLGRCGSSKKLFCSGIHWYMGFKDEKAEIAFV